MNNENYIIENKEQGTRRLSHRGNRFILAPVDNVDSTRDNRPIDSDSTNQKDSRLNASDINRIVGPSIVLRVMAGDNFTISTGAYFHQASGNNNNSSVTLSTIVSSLINSLNGQGSYNTGGDVGLEPDMIGTALNGSYILNKMQDLKNELVINPNSPRAATTMAIKAKAFESLPRRISASCKVRNLS